MSLIPFFALNPEDFYMHRHSPMFSREFYNPPWHSGALHRPANSLEHGARIVSDKDKYQVCLDVQQFSPAEVSVKTVGRQVVVEGRHEEKQDEHGYISRHFIRKYTLPEGYASEDVVSSLSSDGVLTITAPKKQVTVEGERIVPIQASGPVQRTLKSDKEKKTEPAPADDKKMQK